jgi:hypothetical protein
VAEFLSVGDQVDQQAEERHHDHEHRPGGLAPARDVVPAKDIGEDPARGARAPRGDPARRSARGDADTGTYELDALARTTRMEIKRLGPTVAAQLAWMRELLRVP